MNGKQVVKVLQAHEFRVLRVSNSHYILGDGTHKTTVPVHGASDLKRGSLKSIGRQTGVKLT